MCPGCSVLLVTKESSDNMQIHQCKYNNTIICILFLCVHGESLVSCLLLSICIHLVKARSLSLYNCTYYIYLNTLFFCKIQEKNFKRKIFSAYICYVENVLYLKQLIIFFFSPKREKFTDTSFTIMELFFRGPLFFLSSSEVRGDSKVVWFLQSTFYYVQRF